MSVYEGYRDHIEENFNTQESHVEDIGNPNSTSEIPAVSKLREAFDTARNAIIEGSELSRIVGELRGQVMILSGEVHALHEDLDYVRNRNKELDEQVMQVRAARDGAIAEAKEWKETAKAAEIERDQAKQRIESQSEVLGHMDQQVERLTRERDEALMKALQMEEELAKAIAKLSKVEALFKPEASPVPGSDQPRAPTGQFQPKAYDQGSQGSF